MTRRGSPSTGKDKGASPPGTARFQRRFADRFADDFFRPFAGELAASSLGIGTYLGECDDADDASYAAAIRAALQRGINVIDSSINYRCQRSERVVGETLRAAIADGLVKRDEVIICTKGGYVPLDGAPRRPRAVAVVHRASDQGEPGEPWHTDARRLLSPQPRTATRLGSTSSAPHHTSSRLRTSRGASRKRGYRLLWMRHMEWAAHAARYARPSRLE